MHESSWLTHAFFEPAGGGVKFTRVVARDGTVKIPDETWSKEKFETQCEAMQKTIKELEEMVAKLKPAKDYMMAFEPADYAAMGGSEVNMYVPGSVNPVIVSRRRRRPR
jgi:hypothetical protein